MDIYFPSSLFEIAENAVNNLPEPISWSWPVSDVMDWLLCGLKLPQYVVIFEANKIDGKKLIFVNCQILSSMGVRNFDHMKYIAMNVRHLYGLPPDTEHGHNDPSGLRASIHDVYGRYYTQLARLEHGRDPGRRRPLSLVDYMRSVGLVVRGRATGIDCRKSVRPHNRIHGPPAPDVGVLFACHSDQTTATTAKDSAATSSDPTTGQQRRFSHEDILYEEISQYRS